jgi:hypothetical protein
MATEEFGRSTGGVSSEDASQAERHRQELAHEGMSWGLTRTRLIQRLRLRIQRDEAYLGYRKRRGYHTQADDALASDLRVFALAIAYLEERIGDDAS